MDEFALIECILAALRDDGGEETPAWLRAGPGDDAAIVRPPAGYDLANSIDSFIADVHFPSAAAPELIGYRCMMASLSDLAAMAAEPASVLVALSLPQSDQNWMVRLCQGLVEATSAVGAKIAGGNLAAGPLTITLSVQGWAPPGSMRRRCGAQPGDSVHVSGPLGGSARALASLDLAQSCAGDLSALERCYWRPQPPFALASALRAHASSCIDISDGLIQDLGHLCAASTVGVVLNGAAIPLAEGAELDDALGASDDYALAFTSASVELRARFPVIGEVVRCGGVQLDNAPANQPGYRHFR